MASEILVSEGKIQATGVKAPGWKNARCSLCVVAYSHAIIMLHGILY